MPESTTLSQGSETLSEFVEVLVFGLGAIGSFYAFILSRCQNVRLTVVARSNYESVKANGIRLRSQIHGDHTVFPFKVDRTPAEADATFDFVVCAHKAINQEAAAAQLESVVNERTTIVLIQNGVGNEDPFREVFPRCTIVSCVTWVGASQGTSGVIDHIKSENLQVGLFPNSQVQKDTEEQRLELFASLLEEGGTIFEVFENIQIQRWEKVVWNVAWNSITTLTMVNTHAWLASSSNATPLTRRLMTEVIEVAQKSGVPLEFDLVDELIDKILALPPIGSSMQRDCMSGRPLELDVILGVPVRKGRELGVDIPTLETIYTLLVAVDRRLQNT